MSAGTSSTERKTLAWRLDGKGPQNGAWKAVVVTPGMAWLYRRKRVRYSNSDTISVKSQTSIQSNLK